MRKIFFVLMTCMLLVLVGCSKGLAGSYTALIHEDKFELLVLDSSNFTLQYEFVVYAEDDDKGVGTYEGVGVYKRTKNFYIFELSDGSSYIVVKEGNDLIFYENVEEFEKYKDDGIRFIKN